MTSWTMLPQNDRIVNPTYFDGIRDGNEVVARMCKDWLSEEPSEMSCVLAAFPTKIEIQTQFRDHRGGACGGTVTGWRLTFSLTVHPVTWPVGSSITFVSVVLNLPIPY